MNWPRVFFYYLNTHDRSNGSKRFHVTSIFGICENIRHAIYQWKYRIAESIAATYSTIILYNQTDQQILVY